MSAQSALNASPATGADVHAPDKRFAPETSQVKREIWELEGKKHKERDQFHVPWQQQYYVSDYSCLTCSTQARAQVIQVQPEQPVQMQPE